MAQISWYTISYMLNVLLRISFQLNTGFMDFGIGYCDFMVTNSNGC